MIHYELPGIKQAGDRLGRVEHAAAAYPDHHIHLTACPGTSHDLVHEKRGRLTGNAFDLEFNAGVDRPARSRAQSSPSPKPVRRPITSARDPNLRTTDGSSTILPDPKRSQAASAWKRIRSLPCRATRRKPRARPGRGRRSGCQGRGSTSQSGDGVAPGGVVGRLLVRLRRRLVPVRLVQDERVGSIDDWRTSKRKLPGSRTDPSWLARLTSMNSARCSA